MDIFSFCFVTKLSISRDRSTETFLPNRPHQDETALICDRFSRETYFISDLVMLVGNFLLFVLGVVLLQGAVAIPIGAQSTTSNCSTCKGPVHSWKTFPVAFHCAETNTSKDGTFTDEQLDIIAQFPLVTIEKWQGSNAPVFLWEEDAMVATAKQVKTKNPAASVIVWLDSMRIYSGWNYPDKKGEPVNHTLNPDATPGCATGHFLPAEFLEKHPDFLLKNVSGKPALETLGKCHIYNFLLPEVRQYWTAMCLAMTASGVIDGCGADASWQNGWDQRVAWDLDDDTARAWNKGHQEMMRDTTAALGDGLLVAKDPWEIGVYANAALHEGCDANNETITTLRNLTEMSRATKQRGVYECHTYCSSAADCVDSAAAFLVGAGVDHYFVVGEWTSNNGSIADHWFPELFEPSLGEPLSDGVYDSKTASWSRMFGSGTVVTFDTRSNKGEIKWAS